MSASDSNNPPSGDNPSDKPVDPKADAPLEPVADQHPDKHRDHVAGRLDASSDPASHGSTVTDAPVAATREDLASGLGHLVEITQQAPSDHVEHIPARKKRGRQRGPVQLQLTSMIDVIFLLLIYFVITASFVEDEGVLTTKLPEVGQSSVSAPMLELTSELVIDLHAVIEDPSQVQIMVDGQPVAGFSPLFESLVGLQDDPANGRSGLFATDDPVRIKPDRTVRWQHVVNALNAAIRAGYTNVQFVPAGPEGSA